MQWLSLAYQADLDYEQALKLFKSEKEIEISSREPTDSSDDDDSFITRSGRKSKRRQALNRGQRQAGIMSEENIITAAEEDSP